MNESDKEELAELIDGEVTVDLETWVDELVSAWIERAEEEHVCEDPRIGDCDQPVAELLDACEELLERFAVDNGRVCILCGLTAMHSHSCELYRVAKGVEEVENTDLWEDLIVTMT
jgi:hypothetical protein